MTTPPPTYAQALKDWLADCEDKLDDEELKSAKNFSRAFQIWYDRAQSPDSVEMELVDSPLWLWTNVEQFGLDWELEANPIKQRMNPESKTKRIGINYRYFVEYLHRQKIIDDNDLEQSIKASGRLLEDLQRVQRASWVLRHNDVSWARWKKGERGAIPGENKIYEIVCKGENFVLADRCDDYSGHPMSSPENPAKIRIPVSAIRYLKAGDCIDAKFDKAPDGDYLVIKTFTELESGSSKFAENKLRWTPEQGVGLQHLEKDDEDEYAAIIKTIRTKARYETRRAELMKSAAPADAEEEVFAEEWFEEREKDIGSDDEVGEEEEEE